MNCIESLLWGKQNEYHPQKKSATEFGAYILLDSANTSVNVYLQTGPTLSVPSMSWVDDLILGDLENGYRVQTFLHLHPFDASNIKHLLRIIYVRYLYVEFVCKYLCTYRMYIDAEQVPGLRWHLHPLHARPLCVQV